MKDREPEGIKQEDKEKKQENSSQSNGYVQDSQRKSNQMQPKIHNNLLINLERD